MKRLGCTMYDLRFMMYDLELEKNTFQWKGNTHWPKDNDV
jgi:hypothetical protein